MTANARAGLAKGTKKGPSKLGHHRPWAGVGCPLQIRPDELHFRRQPRTAVPTFILFSASFLRSARGMRSDFVVVGDIGSHTEFRCALAVSGNKLVLIAIEEEVKRIAGVGVDHDDIGITHGELSELHAAVTKRNVVTGLFCGKVLGLGRAEYQNDLVVLEANGGHLTFDAGERKHLRGVENQIILVGGDAGNLFGVDCAGNIHSKGVKQAFKRQVGGLEMFGVQADSSVALDYESASGFRSRGRLSREACP